MRDNWEMNEQLDWEDCVKMAKSIPYNEHTELRSLEDLKKNGYRSIPFGESNKEEGTSFSTFFEDGQLKTFKYNLCNAGIFGSSGSSKTQGYVLNVLYNICSKNSLVVLDQKKELFKYFGAKAKELYGEENVHVLDFLDSEHSIRNNPIQVMAERWIASAKKRNKIQLRKNIISDLRKYLKTILVTPENCKDDSWYDTARILIFAIILGMFEDLELTESQEKKIKRKKVRPEQINWASVIAIYQSFTWNEGYRKSVDDHGYFTSRDKKNSLAYLQAKSILNNASNTAANYMGFVELLLSSVIDPKIQQISLFNDFDILSLGETPKVLFVTIDSDEVIREYANVVIAYLANQLLEFTHKTGEALKTPVLFMMDEFPTLRPNHIYPNILATGRGSGIFMHIICQSITQLKVRYPGEWQTMIENCDLTCFVGTNDSSTAEFFAKELGKTTVPDPVAYLQNNFSCLTVPVVNEDRLLHKMKTGEVYIKLHHEDPIHGCFELYYQTKDYLKYPTMTTLEFGKHKTNEEDLVYNTLWMLSDDEEDDDDYDSLF